MDREPRNELVRTVANKSCSHIRILDTWSQLHHFVVCVIVIFMPICFLLRKLVNVILSGCGIQWVARVTDRYALFVYIRTLVDYVRC